MNSYNHKVITAAALKGCGLQNSAINLICTANIDSDNSKFTKGNWLSQHFSRQPEVTGDHTKSIELSIQFRETAEKLIEAQLENLASIILRDTPTKFDKELCNDFDYLLYCMGRACHNVQDFYAHSNWVWLRAEESQTCRPWSFTKNELKGLRLSTWGEAREIYEYLTGFILTRTKKAAEKIKDKILKENCIHGELNLDCLHTKACFAYHKLYKRWGYDVAQEVAKNATITFWGAITGSSVAKDVVPYLEKHSPSNMQAVAQGGAFGKYKDMRKRFTEDMKRLGMPF